MSLNHPEVNHNYVPSYQMSGIPFLTGTSSITELGTTPVEVKFPFTTRWIYVRNSGTAPLRIGFTENGVNGPVNEIYHPTGSNRNYFTLPDGSSSLVELGPLEIKCTSIFFRTDSGTSGFELMAGYTNVPKSQMLVLTSSNGFEGVG